MNAVQPSVVPPVAVLIAGLFQLALLLWIIIFPIVIIRKLGKIEEKLSGKETA